MRISVIAPVKNEAQFIGFSIMAALPFVDEFLYGVSDASTDGTLDLLYHIKNKYAHEKLRIFTDLRIDDGYVPLWEFNPANMERYNAAFNYLIDASKGDACFFLHPDMIITEGKPLEGRAMAWYTTITSYAKDFNTVITKGRCDKWKNIHRKTLGLHYFGGYGSQNEDFYHSAITGKSYKHYGTEFSKYPFQVADSGIKINHYCELKPYARRLEKMKECLKTLYPGSDRVSLEEAASQHPRVTLEPSSRRFGEFAFDQSKEPIPHVFERYEKEFSQFIKEPVHA